MKGTDQLPKSIRKAIRYIKQDAPDQKLVEIKVMINKTIEDRISNTKQQIK